jgi:hypothetical protein
VTCMNHFLRFRAVTAFLTLPAVITAMTGCASSSETPDAGQQQAADCAAIVPLWPVLTVVNAATGAPLCDPTVALLLPGDGGLEPLTYSDCPTTQAPGCPSPAADGAPPPCAFALSMFGEGSLGKGTIAVSAPGFETASVPNVANGNEGCPPEFAASSVTVQLSPLLVDGGADGSSDAAK